MGVRLHMLTAISPWDYYVDPLFDSAGGSINSSSYVARLKSRGHKLYMQPEDVSSQGPNDVERYIEALRAYRQQWEEQGGD